MQQLFSNYEIRILAANPRLEFQVECICCRNAYARDIDAFLRVVL